MCNRRSATARAALLAGAVTLLLGCGACTRPRRAAPPNIVLISIDSLRRDHLGAYGYQKPTSPTIDAFAREGLVFDNALSTSSWTLPAHAAMFTGLNDVAHTMVDDDSRLPEGLPTLAERLRDNGYTTAGFFSGPYLHPGFGLGRGFDEYHNCTTWARAPDGQMPAVELFPASDRDVTNPRLATEVGRRLDRGLRQPFFLFIHFWDPHYDYTPPERYWRLFDPDYAGSFDGSGFLQYQAFAPGMDETEYRHVLALYDGEIRYTDDTLGALMAAMRGMGLLENTLVVITADHGEEFLEHGGRGHRRTLYGEVVRVPLILWHPGRIPPGRNSDLVSLTDIAPTILDFTGSDARLAATGISLLGGRPAGRELLLEVHAPKFYISRVALRSATHKIIHYRFRKRIEAFDLRADPGEKHPQRLEQAAPGEFRRLREQLSKAIARAEARAVETRALGPAAAPHIDASTREHLRALGYE